MSINEPQTANKRICVLLPAHNEETTVKASILEFSKALPKATIIVIDNGSTDDTRAIASQTIETNSVSGHVIQEPTLGKGKALKTALQTVNADIVVICDCDLTYPISQAPKLIEPILGDRADMVTGDRISGGDYERQNHRRFHWVGNRVVNGLTNLLFKCHYKDLATGLRALSRGFVENYEIDATGFEFEVDISIHAAINKQRVLELPISYVNRPQGSVSKLNTYRDGIKYIATVLSRFIRFRFAKQRVF